MILAENVHKRFGHVTALDNLCLEVPAGKVFGLIGPNGAGKTTTIRILCGILRPDSGHVSLNGTSPDQSEKIRHMVGALIEQPGLYGKLNLIEYLNFFSQLYDLKKKYAARRINELLELLELDGRTEEKLQGFSMGMKQKVALARILLHDPPILLLDEPTAGLDPLINKKVRDFLLGQNKEARKTVLVSTHNLDEATRICDEIAMIHQGRVVEQGSWEKLRLRHASTTRVIVHLHEAHPRYLPLIEPLDELTDIALDPSRNTLSYVTTNPYASTPLVIARLVADDAQITQVETVGASLEEAYLELVGQGGPKP